MSVSGLGVESGLALGVIVLPDFKKYSAELMRSLYFMWLFLLCLFSGLSFFRFLVVLFWFLKMLSVGRIALW